MSAASDPGFKQAVEDSRKLKAKPNQDQLLQLYALFKQASQDPPIDKSPAPGMLDITGKAKRRAWQAVVDDGTTPEQAAKKYVTLVEKLKEELGFEA